MTKEQHRREREAKARKAIAEFHEYVNEDGSSEKNVKQTERAIRYIVTRMGRNSVVTDQLASIFLGHMLCFTRREIARDRKDRKAKS